MKTASIWTKTGIICGAVGVTINAALVGFWPAATFHSDVSREARLAALCFAFIGFLVAVLGFFRRGR